MRLRKALAVVLLAAALGGCANSAEVNDKAYVIALGVDKGSNGLLKVTFMFAYPSGGGEEAGGEKIDEKDIVTVEAPSIYSAMRLLDTFKSKRIDTNHTKLVAFSQKLAESRGVFSQLTDLVNTRGFRPSIYVCVTQESPSKLFNSMEPKQDVFIEKFIEHLFSKIADSGTSRAYLYNNYFSAVEEAGSYIIPLVGVTDKENAGGAAAAPYQKPDDFTLNYTADQVPLHGDSVAALCGYAVFVDNKMVGSLGMMEGTVVKMLEKNRQVGQFCVLVPGKNTYANVNLQLTNAPIIRVKTGDAPEISLDISMWGEFTGIGGAFKNSGDYAEFVDYLNGAFSEKILELLEKTRTEYGADIFGFGDKAKINFLRYPEWEAYNWKEKYKNARFSVKVEVDMNDYGELRFSQKN